jgi:hypothetical protein
MNMTMMESETNRAGKNLEPFRKIEPFGGEERMPRALSRHNDNSVLQVIK